MHPRSGMSTVGIIAIVAVVAVIASGSVYFAFSGTSVSTVTQTTTGTQSTTVTQTVTGTQPTTQTVFTNHTMRVVDQAAELDLDPQFTAGNFIAINTYDTLTRVVVENGVATIEPRLATEWQSSAGGTVWIFKLRPNVKFHDGTPVDAAAVKYSFDRVTLLPIRNAPAFAAPFSSTEVVDPLTVRIITKFPIDMAAQVSWQWSAYIASPKMVDDAIEAGIITGREAPKDLHEKLRVYLNGRGALGPNGESYGSGAYIMQPNTYDPNKGAILLRNEDYWRGWKPGQVNRIIFEIIVDSNLANRLLLGGDVDLLPEGLSPAFYRDALANPNVKVTATSTMISDFLEFNTKKAPLDNVLVRRALAHAIPYDSVKNTAYLGFALTPPDDVSGFLADTYPFYSDDAPSFDFNMTKAHELLVQAGYPSGKLPDVKLLMIYSIRWAQFGPMMETIRPYWRELGVELDVRGMQAGPYFGLGAQGLNQPTQVQDIAGKSWGGVYSTFNQLQSLYGMVGNAPHFFSWSYWANRQFQDLIDQAQSLSVSDPAKAQSLYLQAQQLIFEEAPGLAVAQPVLLVAINSNWNGFQQNPALKTMVEIYPITWAGN